MFWLTIVKDEAEPLTAIPNVPGLRYIIESTAKKSIHDKIVLFWYFYLK